MSSAPRGKRRTLAAMLIMAGGPTLPFSRQVLAQAPIYKNPVPAGLMVERWQHSSDPQTFFAPRGDDLRHELWLASREEKHGLLVFFEGPDNAYADLMKESVLRNDEVHSYFKARLRTIALDKSSSRPLTNLRGQTTTESAFASAAGISRTPSLAFFDLYGDQRYVHARPIFQAAAMINFARCMADGIFAQADVERSLRGG